MGFATADYKERDKILQNIKICTKTQHQICIKNCKHLLDSNFSLLLIEIIAKVWYNDFIFDEINELPYGMN